MRIFVVSIYLFTLLWSIPSVVAQNLNSFFQPLTWEQASLYAARENKLLLVEVGNPKQFSEKKLLADKELLRYLAHNVVAIRLIPDSPQGKEFLPHLLMYEPPMFVFSMPYGDLLTWATPDAVAQNPSVLRESYEKAREFSEIKKRNSRSIRFEDLSLNECFLMSEKTGKPIALYFSASQHQPSLLLEKNVLNLDDVADLYNQQFINIRKEFTLEYKQKYGISELPVFVFLNAQGKVIYQSKQIQKQEDVMNVARSALKRAEGLQFQTLTREEALQKAKQENKLLFFHYYREGNAYKELRTVFTDPDVVDFFEYHFINVAVVSDQNSILFVDSEGEEMHRVRGDWTAKELLEEAQKVLEGRGLQALEQRYLQGEREPNFLESYLFALNRAGEEKKSASVAMVYFQNKSPDCLLKLKCWEIFERYVQDPNSNLFQYLLSHREQLNGLYGAEIVRRKERSVWMAGANVFAQGSRFDEIGFREYSKRLKKARVENWRAIVRDARMQIAEKSEDWKTFIALAEVKWNEEKLTDVELYRWGNLIYENCRDEDLRYKMAQWLASRAMELEHQERIRGKSTITSYRGFLEKLVNDLLNK